MISDIWGRYLKGAVVMRDEVEVEIERYILGFRSIFIRDAASLILNPILNPDVVYDNASMNCHRVHLHVLLLCKAHGSDYTMRARSQTKDCSYKDAPPGRIPLGEDEQGNLSFNCTEQDETVAPIGTSVIRFSLPCQFLITFASYLLQHLCT